MNNIKEIIAKNLSELRKEKKLTQLELAEKLNYSDKAVSRWERGDTLPDIEILCKICDIYGVTFDYLISEGTKKEKQIYSNNRDKHNKLIISLLSISLVWFLATVSYVCIKVALGLNIWQVFLWSVPASSIVAIVFNSIWGKRMWTFVFITILVWSILVCFFIQFIQYNFWPIFILGAPLQVSIILTERLKKRS